MEQSFVSTSPLKDRGVRVGTLVRWDPVSKQGSDPMEIYSNEEILIGRSGKLW